MASQYNEDFLPQDIRKELEKILDNHESINWLALIRCMPPNSYRPYQIENFHMETLYPNRSPTRALLNDLAIRRVSIPQLTSWLQQLSSLEHYPRLQSVIARLQSNILRITRQPDELYRQPLGSSFSIKCEASPVNAVTYQWFKARKELVGKTLPCLLLENISKENEGYYICRVALKGQYGHDFSRWAKLEIMESLPALAKPIITTQPQSANQYVLGGILHLYCDAVGDPAPTIQWYKNNVPIPGAANRVYAKANLCIDDEGEYLCVASNSAGCTSSNPTTIKVGKREGFLPRNPTQHGVSDKVALLIGNKDYMNSAFTPLFHPTNDVSDIAGALRSMGFKVVSLVNLTLSEMRFAVKQFYQMLDKDMYALFYFAGHGFEIGNQSYLMPVDASANYLPEENMSASEVIEPMQSIEAKLNMVLLDSCRTRPSQNVNPTEGLQVNTKNVIVVFPCCSKNSVFESGSHPNGFFAIYLLKHIGDHGTISEVIRKVGAGIFEEHIEDPKTKQKQLVYTCHTIIDELSLQAPVCGGTSSRSAELWKAAHEIPDTPQVVYEYKDYRIELCFFAEFSNVLLIHARAQQGTDSAIDFILEPGCSKSERRNGCVFERLLGDKESTLPDLFPRCNSFTQSIRIKDLQRLEGDLSINLEVDLPHETDRIVVPYTMKTKPLYAKIVNSASAVGN